MVANSGPLFQMVDQIQWSELKLQGGFGSRQYPLLVKGAVHAWSAWENWSFERLATLRLADGSEPVVKFQNGLVEQGATQTRPHLAVPPYLLELAEAAKQPYSTHIGLLSAERAKNLQAGELFTLDWNYLQSFVPDRLYLAQWNILDEFPKLREDFAIRQLWPGLRWTWEYVFIGPENTITGLHYDFPHNWFCQVRGIKEFILFPPDQSPHLSVSDKFDWGATLSGVDVSKIAAQPEELAAFSKARGIYARVEPGDALFIPKHTWHSVVSLSPSISLAVFGLTIPEIIFEGGYNELKKILHNMHLYRWGNCTCHGRAAVIE